MLQISSYSGFGGIIRRTPVFVSFGSAKAQSASGGPTDVTNMQIGTAAANRTVIAAVAINDSRATEPTSVSIGGVTATQRFIGRNSSAGGTPTSVAFWTATVPTGTTATVQVGTGGTTDFLGVATFYAYGLDSQNVFSATSSITDPASGNIIVPESRFAIAVAISGGASGATATWTNATEAFDSVVVSGKATTMSGAIINSDFGQTSTVTCDWTDSTSGGRIFSLASWN